MYRLTQLIRVGDRVVYHGTFSPLAGREAEVVSAHRRQANRTYVGLAFPTPRGGPVRLAQVSTEVVEPVRCGGRDAAGEVTTPDPFPAPFPVPFGGPGAAA